MAQQMGRRKSTLQLWWEWALERLDRTTFLAFRLTIPKSYVSPLGFLGMLTFITFLILGVTGALLLLYYYPGIDTAYDSVQTIETTVATGYLIRNIHYHASNMMVFLALAHMYYQYFSGRFKVRNEMLWFTGVILGLITVLEAFTGYDLIFNERAVLAVSIAFGLAQSIPFIGPLLKTLAFGFGFVDVAIRLYAYHVFIIPLIMLILMGLHFPRNLVFDIPMTAGVIGIILIVAGLFPVELGVKLVPGQPAGFTVPEWYLSAIFAFLRTGMDKFVAGVLLPNIWIAMFFIIPFIDTGKRLSWRDRPFFTSLGVASILMTGATTVWGFYLKPGTDIPLEKLFIPPTLFWGIVLLIAVVSFLTVYGLLSYSKRRPPSRPVRPTPITISKRWMYMNLVMIVAFQAFLNVLLYQAITQDLRNLVMFELGVLLTSFAVGFHFYRLMR
jgi:ubiquinol-cytochrome c reductase cytochrome b subunit